MVDEDTRVSLTGWVHSRVRAIEYISGSDVWINGGFFVFSQAIFDYVERGEELVEEPFLEFAVLRKRMGIAQ